MNDPSVAAAVVTTPPILRLRRGLVVEHAPGALRVTSMATREVIEYAVDDHVVDLLACLDGTLDRGGVHRRLQEAGHLVSLGVVDAVLAVLRGDGLLATGPDAAGADPRRTAQLRFLDELASLHPAPGRDAASLQASLVASRVVVLGVGGAGSTVVAALARAGVGEIVVVDADVVEVSNLDRQPLFDTDDVGSHKVVAAAARVATVDPAVRVVPVPLHVRGPADLEPLLDGVDLVVSCADQPSVAAASGWVADAAWPRGLPHIVGGAYGSALGVPGFTVVPGSTACWWCARSAATGPDDDAPSWQAALVTPRGGTISAVTGLVGNMTAWEALRVLLGLPLGFSDRLLELDLMTMQWHETGVPRRRSCPCAGGASAPVPPPA